MDEARQIRRAKRCIALALMDDDYGLVGNFVLPTRHIGYKLNREMSRERKSSLAGSPFDKEFR